jgi:hypothetical protein
MQSGTAIDESALAAFAHMPPQTGAAADVLPSFATEPPAASASGAEHRTNGTDTALPLAASTDADKGEMMEEEAEASEDEEQDASGDGLSAYEKRRQANIERNQRTLEALGLLDDGGSLRPAPTPRRANAPKVYEKKERASRATRQPERLDPATGLAQPPASPDDDLPLSQTRPRRAAADEASARAASQLRAGGSASASAAPPLLTPEAALALPPTVPPPCPKCHASHVDVLPPVERVLFVKRLCFRCGACSHEWSMTKCPTCNQPRKGHKCPYDAPASTPAAAAVMVAAAEAVAAVAKAQQVVGASGACAGVGLTPAVPSAPPASFIPQWLIGPQPMAAAPLTPQLVAPLHAQALTSHHAAPQQLQPMFAAPQHAPAAHTLGAPVYGFNVMPVMGDGMPAARHPAQYDVSTASAPRAAVPAMAPPPPMVAQPAAPAQAAPPPTTAAPAPQPMVPWPAAAPRPVASHVVNAEGLMVPVARPNGGALAPVPGTFTLPTVRERAKAIRLLRKHGASHHSAHAASPIEDVHASGGVPARCMHADTCRYVQIRADACTRCRRWHLPTPANAAPTHTRVTHTHAHAPFSAALVAPPPP